VFHSVPCVPLGPVRFWVYTLWASSNEFPASQIPRQGLCEAIKLWDWTNLALPKSLVAPSKSTPVGYRVPTSFCQAYFSFFTLFAEQRGSPSKASAGWVKPPCIGANALAPMQLREHRMQIYPPGRRFAGPALPLLRIRKAKKLNLMTLTYSIRIIEL